MPAHEQIPPQDNQPLPHEQAHAAPKLLLEDVLPGLQVTAEDAGRVLNEEVLPELEFEQLDGRAEVPAEDTQSIEQVQDDQIQDQALAQAEVQHQQKAVGWLGKLAFWRHSREPREPQASDMSRRKMVDKSVRAGVALWLGTEGAAWLIDHRDQVARFVGHTLHQGGEVKNLITFQQQFEAKMNALPKDEDIERAIPNRGRVINLAEWRERRNIKGPVNIYIVSVGTSNSFAYGTDDLKHPYEQKHSAVYRAATALKDAARRLLGIGEIKTLVLARPGAYSGHQFPGITDQDQPRDGILEQLEDPRIQEFIDQAGPDDIVIFRDEGGFDDLRLLANNIDQIVGTLNRLEAALKSDEAVSDEIQAEFNAFEAKLKEVAAGFNQNFQKAAARVAKYSADRMAKTSTTPDGVLKSGAPIFFEPVYTWSLFDQARVPFGFLKRQQNDAPMPTWMQPDLVDYNPKIPRFFIEIDAIKEGNNLARWAWVELCLAQTAALEQAMRDNPGLEVVPESLIGVNKRKGFYAALVEGKIDGKGDGHPGMLDGGVSGIDFIAARILQIWQQHVVEQGDVSADEYADFPGQDPTRVAA